MTMNKMDRPCLRSLVVLLAASASSSCRDTPLAEDLITNVPPIADAGKMQTLQFNGSPVMVTLDGSASRDPDGNVVAYTWLSGVDAPDGSPGRSGPDPADVMSPTISLTAGTWVFVLFVTDNEGGISQPSKVTIQVGSGVSPEVTECANAALSTITEDCRLCVCGVSDTCRTAVPKCTDDCWNLLFCVDTKCAGIDPSDTSAQAMCATGMCAEFLSAGVLAQAITPCRNTPECPKLCSASAQGKGK
jgi:hypothetical protein